MEKTTKKNRYEDVKIEVVYKDSNKDTEKIMRKVYEIILKVNANHE